MKKLTTILLLLVLIFNFIGYKLVISYMQQNNTAVIEKRVDNKSFNAAELIVVKTSLNLPYYSGSEDFERAYGSIQVDGIEYAYVMRRVFKDTLELLCLPNHANSKLLKMSNEIAKSAVDGNSSNSKQTNKIVKVTLPEYCQGLSSTSIFFSIVISSSHGSLNNSLPLLLDRSRQERPPESV